MEKTIEYRGYKGELKLACDGVHNRGSSWYNGHFNTQIIKQMTKKPKVKTDPRYMIGIEIPANKFANSTGYTPAYVLPNLKPECMLGNGSYSGVWKTHVIKSSENVALKQFQIKKICPEVVWKERDFLIFLKHKRILNIVGAFFDHDAFIATELCYGNLKSVLSRLSARHSIRFAKQLAEALQWCHQNNILHCDLKTAHVLVTTSNNVVLSHFGKAILLSKGTTDVKAKKSLGLPQYQDFESNTKYSYNFESELFSFGCVLYELEVHECLIEYKITVPAKEYINIMRDGRLVNLTTYPAAPGAPRESLKTRVENTAVIFKTAIVGLIEERSKRWSASLFLESAELKSLMKNAQLTEENLDNDLDMVTTEYKQMQGKTFTLKGEPNNRDEIAALHGFYYDEKDVYGEPIKRKALVSYEGHVIAKFLKSTNSVPKLIDTLSSNDPVKNAQLFFLIDEWYGKQSEAMPCSIAEASAEETVESNEELQTAGNVGTSSVVHESTRNRQESNNDEAAKEVEETSIRQENIEESDKTCSPKHTNKTDPTVVQDAAKQIAMPLQPKTSKEIKEVPSELTQPRQPDTKSTHTQSHTPHLNEGNATETSQAKALKHIDGTSKIDKESNAKPIAGQTQRKVEPSTSQEKNPTLANPEDLITISSGDDSGSENSDKSPPAKKKKINTGSTISGRGRQRRSRNSDPDFEPPGLAKPQAKGRTQLPRDLSGSSQNKKGSTRVKRPSANTSEEIEDPTSVKKAKEAKSQPMGKRQEMKSKTNRELTDKNTKVEAPRSSTSEDTKSKANTKAKVNASAKKSANNLKVKDDTSSSGEDAYQCPRCSYENDVYAAVVEHMKMCSGRKD